MTGGGKDPSGHSSGASEDDKKKKKKAKDPMASPGEVMAFIWALGPTNQLIFFIGCLAGVANGAVYPILAYLFSTSFSDISSATNGGLNQVRELAYTFMVVGVYALVMAFLQAGCLEYVAIRASRSFRTQWFSALLRQDSAFYDVYDVAGLAASVGPDSNKFHRGIGRKFGEGVQFFSTFVGGLIYAFYSSWRVALVIMAVLPLVSAAALGVLHVNQNVGSRASKAYSKAGSVAYSTVSAIKTVLSLNAITKMIEQYKEATLDAYRHSVKPLWQQGFAFGSMLGSFILLYCILTLFGTFLIYSDVRDSGCDPSVGVPDNVSCGQSGPEVFGAMLGVAFASQGISQTSNFFETFTAARIAAYKAIQAINRKPGAQQVEIYYEDDDEEDMDKSKSLAVSATSDTEDGQKRLKAILPAYEIDSTATTGEKLDNVSGQIEFEDVEFFYPTRPNNQILHGLNLEIEAGKTTAIVGPSGGGKSTTVTLIERFYDPSRGRVKLDGTDVKDLNLQHLRRLIGYVGQEPTLFATTIAGNIKYGNPEASQEDIEAAAKLANAHDFITTFPDGYDTQVGDKGAQLSGGQKQRIAIARVLVANPKILLLDEATSALDSESEVIVQEALDNVLSEQKRTTVVIAHRLSTIRNADKIAVISGGRVVEMGTHDDLMATEAGHYRNLVDKQEGRGSASTSRSSSHADLTKLDQSIEVSAKETLLQDATVHFSFKDVTFCYPTRSTKKVFDNFSLDIRSGETVALVGPSGGGKSTTVSLIERFYDAEEGSIEYRGVDIRELNLSWYRDQIGYVGQEPTLFNTTIAENIAYGFPGATREQIEDAAKQANIHSSIMEFPDGYDTEVGERGTQLSGGQKQRVAIARALVKQPKVLLLDEATSALDTESEAVVQEALDKLMESKEHTTIVIAHRLSTIRNVDRIAFIAGGKVVEYGSHNELMSHADGRYKRLVESAQRRKSIAEAAAKKSAKKTADEEEEGKPDYEAEIEEAEKSSFSIARARAMATPDFGFMFLGSIGAVLAGGVFPAWGFMFAETIDLLFRQVAKCDNTTLAAISEFENQNFADCQAYFDFQADDMREVSYNLSVYWVVVAAGCVFGNMLTVWGFGLASERLNKRVRDSSFAALIRQEVAFFDKRSVGKITAQLQDDAARIHTFSGEPIRSFIIAMSSMITGVIVSFVFMWPFALVAMACIPVMGFATSIEMKQMLGEDESEEKGGDDKNSQDELRSPGGIVVETLLNIKTVSALTLEAQRLHNYEEALSSVQPHQVRDGFMAGVTSGLSMFIQQWVNALQMWWGGWLLFNYNSYFSFNDFLISMFALLFSLFGLGTAFNGLSDRKVTEASAGRIFYLLDRQSKIDPLSEDGMKLE